MSRSVFILPILALLAVGCGDAQPELPPNFEQYAQLENVPTGHREGARRYEELCAACHGPAATGTSSGPPLIHHYYRPAHHSDAAFRLAVTRGVASHHWNFGDMPPVQGASEADIDAIVGYVRWLQEQAGM